MIDVSKLPLSVRATFKNELLMDDSKIEQMSLFEVLDNYLRWEGVIGYTIDIMNIINSQKETK